MLSIHIVYIKTVLYHYIERINYVDLIDKFAIYVHIEKLVKIFSFMDGYNTLDIYVMYMFILGWDIEREKFLVQYGYLFSIKMFHLKCYGNFQHYTDHICIIYECIYIAIFGWCVQYLCIFIHCIKVYNSIMLCKRQPPNGSIQIFL